MPDNQIIMAELKTVPTKNSIKKFLDNVENEKKREDSYALLKLFKKTTGEKPVLWGNSIIGFGKYHYKSERSAQEGDWPLTGFSPRKQNLTIYIMPGFGDLSDLLNKLGKHKTSVSCLYINKLEDVNIGILEKIIQKSVKEMRHRNNIE